MHLEQRILETLEHIERHLRSIDRKIEPTRHRLSSIKVAISARSTKQGVSPMAVQGPVTLTSVGQVATASINGYDQFGSPMPTTFVMPPVTYSIDNPAVATSVPNADGITDAVTAVANGVANLTASLTSPEGLALTDTETITVAIPTVAPVLTSIKVAFQV